MVTIYGSVMSCKGCGHALMIRHPKPAQLAIMNKLWMIIFPFVNLAGSFNITSNFRYHGADFNIRIVSSPELGVDTVCVNQFVNLTCLTEETLNHITWYWLNQSKEGAFITVLATQHEVLYTCRASGNNSQTREENVTVVANGSPPHVYPQNFRHYDILTEGNNITLITNITSDLPLSSGYPAWRVSNHDLPSNAIVDDYVTDGVLHSTLTLYELSYYDDSGNYTNIASNECGTSLTFVYIYVKKACVKCTDSGIKIIESSQNITTVSGQYIQSKCLVQGNLCSLDLSLTHYWTVTFPPSQKREPLIIYDNSTDPYRIAVYSNCKSCCNFTSQLTILSVPPEMSGVIELTCVEHLEAIDPLTQRSITTLTVLNTPKILSSSAGDICTTINSNESLHCLFNAATMEGATIVVWLKDQSVISGYDNETRPVPGKEDEVISILNVKNISQEDQGRYTCYCYYNKSIVMSDKPVISDQAVASVHLDCSEKDKTLLMTTIGLAVGVVIIFITVTIMCGVYKRRSVKHSTEAPLKEPIEESDSGDTIQSSKASSPLLRWNQISYGSTNSHQNNQIENTE